MKGGGLVLSFAARLAALTVIMMAVTACVSDQTVQLRYLPDPRIERLAGAQPVTVFRFADRRGDEGDGDPRRVGGIYDGYGSRLAKVLSSTPWPDTLVESLIARFAERGVPAVAVPDREFVPGATAVSTPFVLGGEIHNFSTETRWTLQAHVSGVVRLYDHRGNLLLTKTISARMPRDAGGDSPEMGVSGYQAFLNQALRQFVHAVVTDPDISQRLVAGHSAVPARIVGTPRSRARLWANEEGAAGSLGHPERTGLYHHRQSQGDAAQGAEHGAGRLRPGSMRRVVEEDRRPSRRLCLVLGGGGIRDDAPGGLELADVAAGPPLDRDGAHARAPRRA
jgi:hypothetical protein